MTCEKKTVTQGQLLAHEVLHTASVIFEMWDRHILEHLHVEESEALSEKAQEAFDAMHDFYSEACKRSGLFEDEGE